MIDSKLGQAITEVLTTVRQIPEIGSVPDGAPDELVSYPGVVWFCQLGPMRPTQHRDSLKRTVWGADHILTLVWVDQATDDATVQRRAIQALETIQLALLARFDRDRFARLVFSVSLLPREMGWADEDNDRHFAAALDVVLGIMYPVDAGKLDG